MLIKRRFSMPSLSQSVKKMAACCLALMTANAVAIAPSASASETLLVEKTVTVKFRLSDLEVKNGVEKTYGKIKKRAKSYCRADRSTLHYTGQSWRECAADLVDQFIESADVQELTEFHAGQPYRF